MKLQQGIQALLDKGILQVEDLSVQESVEGVEEEVFEDATDEFADVVPVNFVIPSEVSAVNEEDGDSDCDIDNWVRPKIPGEVINNWSSEEIIQVTLLEE